MLFDIAVVVVIAVVAFLVGKFHTEAAAKAAVKAEIAKIEAQIKMQETSVETKFSADAKAVVARIKSVI